MVGMTDDETEPIEERCTKFVATVHWDEDSEFDDVGVIRDALEQQGYDTRMASNNSQLLVMREGGRDD